MGSLAIITRHKNTVNMCLLCSLIYCSHQSFSDVAPSQVDQIYSFPAHTTLNRVLAQHESKFVPSAEADRDSAVVCPLLVELSFLKTFWNVAYTFEQRMLMVLRGSVRQRPDLGTPRFS